MKNERAENASLLATYAERLEQMNQSHATLNQTIIDLSISLQTFITDAKKRDEMKEMAAEAVKQARAVADEKAA